MNFYKKACFDFHGGGFTECTYLFYRSISPCFYNSDTLSWDPFGGISGGKKGAGLDYLYICFSSWNLLNVCPTPHIFAEVFTIVKLGAVDWSVVSILPNSPWQVLG